MQDATSTCEEVWRKREKKKAAAELLQAFFFFSLYISFKIIITI